MRRLRDVGPGLEQREHARELACVLEGKSGEERVGLGRH